MERLFTSTEIEAWENNDLAIERAVEALKARLSQAPDAALSDVLKRCDPDSHGALIDWIASRKVNSRKRRLPKAWSPKRTRQVWILYTAADLECPPIPPAR